MTDKPKLSLIKRPEPLKAANNFWRCCPLSKEYLPEAACPQGQPGGAQEPSCPWFINSEAHNYCFWRYVKDKSDPDGTMKELVQSELAALFGWSNTKTHFMLKQAMAELTEALRIHGASELLNELDPDAENEIVADDYVDAPREEPSE